MFFKSDFFLRSLLDFFYRASPGITVWKAKKHTGKQQQAAVVGEFRRSGPGVFASVRNSRLMHADTWKTVGSWNSAGARAPHIIPRSTRFEFADPGSDHCQGGGGAAAAFVAAEQDDDPLRRCTTATMTTLWSSSKCVIYTVAGVFLLIIVTLIVTFMHHGSTSPQPHPAPPPGLGASVLGGASVGNSASGRTSGTTQQPGRDAVPGLVSETPPGGGVGGAARPGNTSRISGERKVWSN